MLRLRSTKLVVGLAVAFFLLAFFTSSKVIFSQSPPSSAPAEAIGVFSAADCRTPKTVWDLGETLCAMVTRAVEDQRIAWIAPDGTIAQVSGYLSGDARDSYRLQTGSDALAQVGTWRITVIDHNGVATVGASFVVRDPHHASADLSLTMFGAPSIAVGSDAVYRLEVTNNGPNEAAHVTLTNAVPPSTTFVSQTQNSGPRFTCANPPAGDASGAITCTIPALPSGHTAVFTFVFKVDPRAPTETEISDEASVASQTDELREANNKASFSTSVTSPTPPCAVTCPANLTINADPNESGAVVSYQTPTRSGDCAVEAEGGESGVVCNTSSGTLFPMGTTVVTCSSVGGGSCRFTVTVRYNFKGFFPPVSNGSEVNVVDAGSAVPVKFSLSGDHGQEIFAQGFPASGVVTCNSTDPPSQLQEVVMADTTNLSYDAKSDQYQYLWKTESSWAETCRQLIIKLNDGSAHRASFKFK